MLKLGSNKWGWQLIYIFTELNFSKLFAGLLDCASLQRTEYIATITEGNRDAFFTFLFVSCFVWSPFKIWKFILNWILGNRYNDSERLHIAIAMLWRWKKIIKRNHLKCSWLEIGQKCILTSNKITFGLSGRIFILMKWWLGAKLIISIFVKVWAKAVRKKLLSLPLLPAKQWRMRTEALYWLSPTFPFAPRAWAVSITMK